FQWDAHHLVPLQRGHSTELFGLNHFNRLYTKSRSQYSIKRRRRATALNIAEDGYARFNASAFFDLASQYIANATKTLAMVNISALLGREKIFVRVWVSIFGNDDDGK